ncbi:MAG: PepSY domain-containing protein [Symploca sp. SIO2C1]|nr:PepSY domain-containing protein [Symploca sp. SIO2C1]
MSNLRWRKLHRKIAPIVFLPLFLSALTGIFYRLGYSWFSLSSEQGQFLLSIHQGSYLGNQLKPIYVLLVGLGLLGMIVSGLTMTRLFGSSRPERPGSKLNWRKVHRLVAPIIFLPLAVSAVTGLLYRLGRSWFGLSYDQVGILLSIHQGSYLGNFLKPIYVLLVGLGLIGMLVTGINMTGIFRKRRQN